MVVRATSINGQNRSITYSTGRCAKAGFPFLRLSQFSFNANSTFFGVALCTATTDQCSAIRAAIRRPMRHGNLSSLRVAFAGLVHDLGPAGERQPDASPNAAQQD